MPTSLPTTVVLSSPQAEKVATKNSMRAPETPGHRMKTCYPPASVPTHGRDRWQVDWIAAKVGG